MAKVRPFVNGFVKRVKKFSKSSDKKDKSFVDISEGSVCRVDGSTEELLKCLVGNMREHQGEYMVCVSESDLGKSDASLRAIARKLGVSLRVKRKVVISGVDDAICLRISKDDKKRLLEELA